MPYNVIVDRDPWKILIALLLLAILGVGMIGIAVRLLREVSSDHDERDRDREQ